MHRHASLQATAETYARSVLEIGPDDRCLSVAKLFFAYGLGNSLTFPALGRGQRRAQSPASDAGRRAWPCPAERPTLFFATPASSPHCSTPTPRRRVRLGAAHGHRR